MIVREVEAVQVESVKGEHCHHCAECTPPLHLISAPMFAHTAIKYIFFFNTGNLNIYFKTKLPSYNELLSGVYYTTFP